MSFPSSLLVVLALLLGSCASVDQFGSRMVDGNTNSQDALNQEILLNILRASNYQSLNFVGISQISGSQTEQLSTGLPTAVFGHAAAAQAVYQLSNSLQSGVTGGYQASPLISTSFQSGLLAPVPPRYIRWLIGSHPRSVVLFSLLQAINVKTDKGPKIIRFVNDPERDYKDPAYCDDVAEDLSSSTYCSYTKFVDLLNALEGYGLTVDFDEAPTSATSLTGASGAAPSTSPAVSSSNAQAHFCFDAALAAPEYQAKVAAGAYQPQCGKAAAQKVNDARSKTETFTTKVNKSNGEDTTTVTISGITPKKSPAPTQSNASLNIKGVGSSHLYFEVRSPQQYFNYLGIWARRQTLRDFPGYTAKDAKRVINGQAYLDIREGIGINCYASVSYQGRHYCVPTSAVHSAMLMDIGESLRNLNITPSDLNSAFTVRLTP